MATEFEVDVARVGTFRGMGNRVVDLTRRVLEDLAASLNLAAFRPKVWAGHTTELRSDTPALGDVVGLRVIGERLMARLRLTDAGARRMREGNYTERSMELDFVGGKAKFLGLALLGARRPAISGLTPFYLTSPAAESPGMILLAAGDDEEEESPDLTTFFAADPGQADFYRAARSVEQTERISFAEAARRVARDEPEVFARYWFSR